MRSVNIGSLLEERRDQWNHHRPNTYKGKMEEEISGISIIATFRAAEKTTEKLFLAVPTQRLLNSRGTHLHRQSGRVYEGDAMLLVVTPNRATSRPRSYILIHHNFLHCHRRSGQEDGGEDLLLAVPTHSSRHGGSIEAIYPQELASRRP